MDDTASKTVCIVDNGLFASLAQTLSPHFGRTLYYSSWKTAFPRSNTTIIGKGIPGVERIDWYEPYLDEIDLFVFPDIFFGPLQTYLRKQGKRVWGAGMGDSLEYMRGHSKKWLKNLGLPVGPHRVLRGMTELRRHLQSHDDQHVKISLTRGDMETFHAKSYPLIEPRLDELEHALGAKKTITEFVVEDGIEAKAEVGYDGFTIDGQYPSRALFGVETKDAGYVGKVEVYSAMPRAVGYINNKLAPLFRDLKYRGFWSSEIRVAEDGTPYLIDPCCRMASPPGELYQYLITNLAEVMWHGADGELVEPEWRYPWGAQLVMKSDWAVDGWQPIEFPAELNEHVHLHYLTLIGGKPYFVPQPIPMPEIGSVVAGGKTRDEAIANVKAIAEEVQGYDLRFNPEALEKAAAGMDAMVKAA